MLERKVLEFIAGAVKDNDIDYMIYIKNKLTNFYLTFLSIVIILPLASSLYRAEDIGWQPIFYLHILNVIIIFLASAFRKHISTKQKSILLIFLSYRVRPFLAKQSLVSKHNFRREVSSSFSF